MAFLRYFVSLVASERCSTSAQRAKPTMSLKVVEIDAVILLAERAGLQSASARSIVRATRNISEVG